MYALVWPVRRSSLGLLVTAILLAGQTVFGGCGGGASSPALPPFEPTGASSGGETTIFLENSLAFENPAANLSAQHLEEHLQGDFTFGSVFVTPPAPVNPGLGPLFNNASCSNCHIKNGRGRLPLEGETIRTVLVRLSVPGEDATTGGPVAAPGFGHQLQLRGTFGRVPEAELNFAYDDIPGTYGDGEAYILRKPRALLTNPYRALPVDLMTSVRVAPAILGLGLLEALDESTILAAADPDDANGDGISGRPNRVWDVERSETVLGRFGWKANQPNLLQQTAAAYRNDMGVTSRIFQVESSDGQDQSDGRPDDPELPDEVLDITALYTQTLAVPARRRLNDSTVQRGERLFHEARCSACHRPTMTTGTHADVAELSNQRIQPFTDMLLHDMGPDLADGRPDFLASGSEWRTPPLWGTGLLQVINNHEALMHDGRARGFAEAILWHGGEAEGAKEAFRSMPKSDREALLAFLRSL